MKKILSNIIFSIVIGMCGYLVIANLFHVLYLSKYDTYNFNSKPMTDIKNNIETLETNINKISKLDNSTFTSDDLTLIKDNLNNALKSIKANKLLSYKGNKKLYLKDLFEIDMTDQSYISGNIAILEALAKYDSSISSYTEVYKYDFMNNAFNSDFTFQETIQAYKYNTRDFFNANIYEAVNVRVLARIYKLSDYVVKENYLTTLVLKIGGDNNV